MYRYIRLCLLGVLIVSAMSNATTLSGTVSDSVSGTKLANVIVSLRSTTGGTLFRDTTDSTGAYSIASVLTPGAFTLRATVAGYVQKNTGITIDTSVATLATDFQLIKIDTASVTGTVTDSATGTPITGAIVSLGNGFPRDTTKSDGVYTFAKVASGSYSVSVAAPTYVSKNVAVAVSGTAPITVNVPLVQISYATISGAITDSATPATLIQGAIVSLRNGNTTIKIDTTKADGLYKFDSVATGAYTVRASAAHYVTKAVNDSVKSSAPITSNIALTGIIYATISGTIADSATPATLIQGAIVSLRSGYTTLKTDTTKADGLYSFDSVAAGAYTVQASAAHYVTKTVTDSVKTTATVTSNIALAGIIYSTISGTVTDSATPATLIQGAIVSLRSGNTTLKTDTTKADGLYSFDSVAAGAYTVRASATHYVTKTITDSVKTTATVTSNIALAGIIYSAVSGTISDSLTPATLIQGAIVSLRNGNATVKIDTTKADGKYSFDSVATGTYTVATTAAGYIAKTESAPVPSATPVAVDFALVKQSYGSLSGLVKDSASGTVLKGAIIALRNGYTTIKTDTTGADGAYSFDSIPIGVYTVRATDSSYTTKNVTDSVKVNVAGTIDFLLAHPIDKVLVSKSAMSPEKSFSLSSSGMISFGNGAEAGFIKVYALNGKLLYKHAVNRSETSLALPENLINRGNAVIVKFSGTDFSSQKKMVLP
jgi:protocatechuate 3,4-dioxygenase beta subunit